MSWLLVRHGQLNCFVCYKVRCILVLVVWLFYKTVTVTAKG